MVIHEAKYIGSFPNLSFCPKPALPEYVFIGRSNVGKSSLINMLCGRKELAHVSKKPGKTQMINYYLVDKEWYIVDLPGYGYANRAKTTREEFSEMITEYLLDRESLQCAFVLLDANTPPQLIDVEFINWLGENSIPFVLCYTKTDRLKTQQEERNIEQIATTLSETWNELPQQFRTSAVNNSGKKEILKFIQKVNKKSA